MQRGCVDGSRVGSGSSMGMGICVDCGKGCATTRRGGGYRGVARTALAGARTRSGVGSSTVTV